METLNLIQGSPEWLEARSTHDTASEAPAMLGDSKYQSRDELMSQKKYGAEKEITPHLQKLFDKGHATEASIRPVIEKLIGKELYPITGSVEIYGLKLLASFDGLTMLEDIVFEHKLWNEALAKSVRDDNLSPNYYWQLEQQLLVSGAEKAIFVVSDGTEENIEYCWYEPVPGRAEQLIAGWKQFAIDLESHEHVEAEVKPVATVIEALPALMVELAGEVKNTNIAVYEESTIAFIQGINSELTTDEDFANAEQNVKFCADAEKQLAAAKQHALAQTADIDKLFSTIDRISEELRSKRLMLDKLVKSQKAAIKSEIVNKGSYDLQAHVDSMNESLDGSYISIAEMGANFPAVIKGKRTMQSIKGAINDELARVKILGNEIAETIRANLKVLNAHDDYRFLFNDIHQIVKKSNDDFALLVRSRVDTHKEAEAEKERVRLADEAEKARIAAEAAKTEEVPQEASVSEVLDVADQSAGNELVTESTEPEKTMTAAEIKKQQADIAKLKKYVARLNDYKVPALEDAQCIDICGKITEQLMTYQDRLGKLFLESTEEKS